MPTTLRTNKSNRWRAVNRNTLYNTRLSEKTARAAKLLTDVANTSTSSDLARACPWRVPGIPIQHRANLEQKSDSKTTIKTLL